MTAGEVLFARYAYAPNELGYCGPAESAALLAVGAGEPVDCDVRQIARGFTGAWPYLRLLAEHSGLADPLDADLVRAYWLGGPLPERIDQAAFGAALLERLGAQAGHYWQHLTPDLLPEASATHGFHVFGVYPWTRLLNTPLWEEPLRVLDRCRIRWGRVHHVDGDEVIVRSRPLTWDGCVLGLGAARGERLPLRMDGRAFVADPAPGEWLALHWNRVCDRLDAAELRDLQRSTGRQLRATNARLRRAAAPAASRTTC